jgi:hypothetical protein
VNIQDAIDVIESVSGFTDQSTPVGEAWLEVLSFIHRPAALAQPEPEDLTGPALEDLRIIELLLKEHKSVACTFYIRRALEALPNNNNNPAIAAELDGTNPTSEGDQSDDRRHQTSR